MTLPPIRLSLYGLVNVYLVPEKDGLTLIDTALPPIVPQVLAPGHGKVQADAAALMREAVARARQKQHEPIPGWQLKLVGGAKQNSTSKG